MNQFSTDIQYNCTSAIWQSVKMTSVMRGTEWGAEITPRTEIKMMHTFNNE